MNDTSVFVCPMPRAWARIHTKLKKHWQDNGCAGSEPPKPLILNGWMFSNDIDKQECWKSTVQWAEERDLSEKCTVTAKESYYVRELSAYRYMEDWYYGPHDPAPSADRELIADKLADLKNNWSSIAGQELASHTNPLRFTGKKRRRLVVSKDESDFSPPWGSWWTINFIDKEAFSSFRQAVNKAIEPHYIDHIDFI